MAANNVSDGVIGDYPVPLEIRGSNLYFLLQAGGMIFISAELCSSAALVAGSVLVALPQIAASSIVLLTRQIPGGTLGHLSVDITPAFGFTINSSSATETSTIAYLVFQPD